MPVSSSVTWVVGWLRVRRPLKQWALPLLAIVFSNCSDCEVKPIGNINSGTAYGSTALWIVDRQGYLHLTQDGGDTWASVSGDKVGGFDHLSFIDGQRGWCNTKRREVLRTTDGGMTWSTLAIVGSEGDAGPLGEIRFMDENFGWMVNPLIFYRTEDGGQTWNQIRLKRAYPKDVFSCFFIDKNIGWLTGSSGAFYKTADGGITWNESNISAGDEDLADLRFNDSQVGWTFALTRGAIYRTDDLGKNWRQISLPAEFLGVWSAQFVSDKEGWAIAVRTPGARNKGIADYSVLHTIDRGTTWDTMNTPIGEPVLNTIHFGDQSAGG